MKKEDIIKIINNNEEKEYILLAIFTINGKQYIVYKDIDNDSINKNLLASRVDEFKSNMKLFPLTDEEWNTVEEEYKKIINGSIEIN